VARLAEGSDMDTPAIEVNEHLQFAYEVCQDNNAYTSAKSICEIITDGAASLSEDKIEFAYSIFPELR
jgi:hypothetical protein